MAPVNGDTQILLVTAVTRSRRLRVGYRFKVFGIEQVRIGKKGCEANHDTGLRLQHEPKTQMHTSINQMLYPDRQAFFEKLALSFPPRPAIKIGPAPMPSAERKRGLWIMRRAVPTQRLSTAQRRMQAHR
jgi:hypothetical protein